MFNINRKYSEHKHLHILSQYSVVTYIDMWNFFFIDFICMGFFFFFLATLGGMQDLSSLTRDRAHAACIGSSESLNHLNREVPAWYF